MEDLKDYYRVLQVSPGASQSAIRVSYRQLAKKYHPDRGGLPEQMILINEAYSVLSRSVTTVPPIESVSENTARQNTPPTEDPAAVKSRKYQPWMRLGARLIDTLLGTLMGILVIYLILSLLLPNGIHPETAHYLLVYAPYRLLTFYLLLWTYLLSYIIMLESVQLAVWGSTPGRWLFSIVVFDLNQDSLTFRRALRRSLSVWSLGLGLGLPFITPFTLYASYYRLTRIGSTIWDEDMDFFVTNLGPDVCRLAAAALLVLLLLFSALHFLPCYFQGLWW